MSYKETASASLPSAEQWADVSQPERERRRSILDDIARRVAENGPRTAWDHPDRARQFMPFDALKGYGAMVDAACAEDSSGEDDRMGEDAFADGL